MASKSRPEVGVREAEMSLTAIVAHQKLIDEAKVRLEKAEVHVKSERRAYDKLVSQMGDVIRSYTQPHLFQQGVTVSDEDLEWAVRLALEVRRRVKEQQKRIGAAEFRNTHFSYQLGAEGVEKFVSTPELQSQGGIGDEPLECGQIWTLSPGGAEEHPGLFRQIGRAHV